MTDGDRLTVVPLTPGRWEAFAELMAEGGPSSRCWCMYWRTGAAYRRVPADRNRQQLQAIVQLGPAPGLLALDAQTAVGWCQLTPRADLPALDVPWRVRRVDDVPVWVVSCFYVRKTYRRQGVTALLVTAAIEHARAAGAPALEAYPLDPSVSPSSTSTGYAETFARAGFVEIARRSPERPVVRLTF